MNGEVYTDDEISDITAGEYNVQAIDASGCLSTSQQLILVAPEGNSSFLIVNYWIF